MCADNRNSIKNTPIYGFFEQTPVIIYNYVLLEY